VQTERLRQEHGHLPARQRRIRAEVPVAATRRDPGRGERLDELEERVARVDVAERRAERRRADWRW
jgi:hypothetical protein